MTEAAHGLTSWWALLYGNIWQRALIWIKREEENRCLAQVVGDRDATDVKQAEHGFDLSDLPSWPMWAEGAE